MDKIRLFSRLMFDETDKVCCGSLFDNKVVNFLEATGSMFYTINPIDARIDYDYKKKDTYDYLTPRRADINVSRLSNFMFEMDDIPLDDQLSILHNCGVEWTAIVYSGSKSYHALLAVDKSLGGEHTLEGIENYKMMWKRIAMKIDNYAHSLGFADVVDQSGKNPSRFTRYVGTIRSNGNEQKIISMNKRIRFVDFQSLIESCPKIFVTVVKGYGDINASSVEEFFENAPQSLVDEVKYPSGLAAAGLYPKLLRLSLWARDLNVSKELWSQVLEYRMFPKLLQAGYPEHKLMVAINHAYSVEVKNGKK